VARCYEVDVDGVEVLGADGVDALLPPSELEVLFAAGFSP
jgi:hypothetical protein